MYWPHITLEHTKDNEYEAVRDCVTVNTHSNTGGSGGILTGNDKEACGLNVTRCLPFMYWLHVALNHIKNKEYQGFHNFVIVNTHSYTGSSGGILTGNDKRSPWFKSWQLSFIYVLVYTCLGHTNNLVYQSFHKGEIIHIFLPPTQG